MKFVPPDQRQAISAFRLALSLVVTALVPLLLYAAPTWWSQRNVLIQNTAPDDYAAANQGQLKNIARGAAAEMDARIPGGAGEEIHTLITTWLTPTSQTNDFAPLTVGQLKMVVRPFYNRLIAVRYAETYPWVESGTAPDDFAVANIGQVKNLFNFDLLSTDATHDRDSNKLPDWWEKYYFGKPGIDPNAPAPRADGLTNLEAFQRILDPIDAGQFLALTPERIDQIVPTDQMVTRLLSITNNTNGTQQLTFTAHSATTTSQYVYADSDQENGPQFIWNDISGSGTHMDNVSEVDDGSESLQLSFSFPFSGQRYSTIYVGSNGYVTLGQGWNEYWNEPLPSPFAQGPLIAAFWDDLDLSNSGDIYFQDFGEHVVIQFTNAIRHDGDGFATFQIVLHRDGTILLYYKEMLGTLDQATVGVQSASPDDGFTIAYNQPYLKSELAVRITQKSQWQPAPWLEISPRAASLPPGATAEALVTFDARDLIPSLLAGGITVSSDAPIAPREMPVMMTVVDESQLDNDHDGLTNGQERTLGTDPNNIDTDRDGMADGWEVAHALNPLINDSSEDPDGDGYDNLQEYKHQTDPFVFAAPARVVETFDNWNYVNALSGDMQLDATNPSSFDGDTSRAARTSPNVASLTYWMPALVSVDLTVYYKGSLTLDQIRFYASPDNATWTEIAVSKIADWAATADWHGAILRQSETFMTDTRYLRIDISGPDPAWTPQLSQLVFVHTDLNRPVADSQNVTVFAGAAAALLLKGRDTDGDTLTFRITEQPSHGALSGAPPHVIYTAASDYTGQDRFSFVTNDGARDSAPTDIYVTIQAALPPPPSNLTFTELSSSDARLTWTAGAGDTSFIVERSTDGGLTWQQIGEMNGATTSIVDSSYRSGTFYSYRVRAKGDTGSISDASTQISSQGTNPTITDSDGDGVLDNLEAQRHSNPNNKDTDGDGVPDDQDGAPNDPTRWAKAIERQYAVIDLGTLPGSPGSRPLAMNNLGHVLCAAEPYGRYFLWQNGRRTGLPGNFTPYNLNDSDIIVGDTTFFNSFYSRTVSIGAYWRDGQMIRLPLVPISIPGVDMARSEMSWARAINNANEIVGWSSPDGSGMFATKWVAGGAGGTVPSANLYKVHPFDISDSGAVLATVETGYGYDIYLLPATRLVTSRDSGATSNGYRVNSSGIVVSRGRYIWPQGATGGPPQDVNSLLQPESATTIDFSYTITDPNEILADGHDETGDYYLSVVRLARENSPTVVYKVVESDPRIEYIIPVDMNDNGLIAGTAVFNDHTDHAILLVPAELMVDGNRDGEMSFNNQAVHAADQTSEERPYRFWVNDDQDAISGTNLSEEVTPPQLRDNQDEKIQSVRDCEDLARVWLNIGGLADGFKTGEIQLVLRFRNVKSGNPAIRAFRAVENGGRQYLSDEAWGTLQSSAPYDQALPGSNGPGIASSTTGVYLDRRRWEGIDASDPVINLLFEGVDEGLGELYFDIIKDGQRIGVSPGVWLDIKHVEKMYERAKAQPENIVGPYSALEPFTGPVTYVSDPNGQPFEKPWDETDQCLVFVHGWNVSYDEYGGVAQTMFKRLWHQGFKGHFASFRWDTRKSDGMFDAGEYNRSENRAYVYGASLKEWITNLSTAYSVSIIAHSMGNVLCGEALRQGLRVRNYLLMEAAIPMSCYAPDAERLSRLEDQDRDHPTPDYHLNPTTNEITLGYRGYIATVNANIINFYNEADWALATGKTLGIDTNWERNQIDYKPDGSGGGVHNPLWNYDYDLTQRLPFRAWIASTKWRYVTDSWEMKAFVARSRTKAVGSFPGGGAIGETENLRDFGFGNQRPDHSGQFTRNVQAVDLLYKRMRERIEE